MCKIHVPFILTMNMMTSFQIQDKVTKNLVFLHTLYHDIRWVVLCVRDSAQTASHIYVPINCTIIVDVQDAFHFNHNLISNPKKGHKNLVFLHILYRMGGILYA